eukprot:TRINITY_DN82005_c0_g1_i1.p1 TRINITY_DN82005_c0_g1~~TRINITY_DN82005_c0_g1_i1.p1  ORF type:complete len:274 (-),score=23.10 TRINITY_DN82005_c0_g1_i1:331-1152(-)
MLCSLSSRSPHQTSKQKRRRTGAAMAANAPRADDFGAFDLEVTVVPYMAATGEELVELKVDVRWTVERFLQELVVRGLDGNESVADLTCVAEGDVWRPGEVLSDKGICEGGRVAILRVVDERLDRLRESAYYRFVQGEPNQERWDRNSTAVPMLIGKQYKAPPFPWEMDALETYSMHRRSVEFAKSVAAQRPEMSDVTPAEVVRDYESRRQTVRFAEQASQQREVRLGQLVHGGQTLCRGSSPNEPYHKPDFSWHDRAESWQLSAEYSWLTAL